MQINYFCCIFCISYTYINIEYKTTNEKVNCSIFWGREPAQNPDYLWTLHITDILEKFKLS
jgi:hypothetical protein